MTRTLQTRSSTLGLAMTEVKQAHLSDHPLGEAGIMRSLQEVAKKAREGRLNQDVISWVGHKLVAAGQPSGNLSRAEAIYKAFKQGYAYMHDPRDVERMAAAHLTLGDGKDKAARFPGGDCFAEGTLLLTEGHKLVPIERVEMGTRIWGLNGWTRVLIHRNKGSLPITVVALNNGSQLRLTDDHNMNVLVCRRHPRNDDPEAKSGPCACPAEERVMEKVRVSDLRPGMVLPSPSRLPFGDDTSLSPERSYVEGLYLADGWSETNRFSISGKDGCPKEQQKREVQTICERLGIKTHWHEKHLRVSDPVWTERMVKMGTHAPCKHLLSLNLAEPQAREALRGIMADSGKNSHGSGRTFTTTSRTLAVQVRLLHKMMGVSCGWSHIEDHGGLGKNPIWRLTTRAESANGRQEKLLRVREVLSAVEEAPCYDIQTEDGMVYLPEHDVTVHNCDDAAIAYAAACEAAGIPTAIVGAGYDAEGNISHVLCMVSDGEGRWAYADPSAKSYDFGQAKTATREIIIDTLTGDVLCDDTRCSPRMQGRRPPEAPGGGAFLSLDGVEEGVTVYTIVEPLASLGSLAAEGNVNDLNQQDRDWLQGWLTKAIKASDGLVAAYKMAVDTAKALGTPLPGSVNNLLFDANDLQRAVDIEGMLDLTISSIRQVLAGERKVGMVEGGFFGPDLIIERLPTDKDYVGFDLKKREPFLYRIDSNEVVHRTGTLGFPLIPVVVGVAVVTISIAGSVIASAWSAAERAKAAAAQATQQAEYELVRAGKGAELEKVYEARRKLIEAQSSGSTGAQVATAVNAVTKLLAVAGALALIGGAVVGVRRLMKGNKAA